MSRYGGLSVTDTCLVPRFDVECLGLLLIHLDHNLFIRFIWHQSYSEKSLLDQIQKSKTHLHVLRQISITALLLISGLHGRLDLVH